MGEQNVSLLKSTEQKQAFMRHLLNDVKAMEYMLEHDYFESGVKKIGAEQEICLVDKNFKPAPVAMEVLERAQYPWLETELARFNLEANLQPREFTGTCLSDMEQETKDCLNTLREKTLELDTEVLITGILPTLRKFHMSFDNLTPKKRYRALMDAMIEMRAGNQFELRLSGIDELMLSHDSPLLEACNTSFQIHLQVSPGDFVKMYNIAQALAGPIIAIGSNSPLLFGKRLWHETRIALFQQAIDTRKSQEHMREQSPRVTFGKTWLQDSILDIYREDIARFRVLISGDVQEDALEMLKKGETPSLKALQVHNSTVYRWNRACFGMAGGMPHLRIENRVLPAGPTVLDEIANAAFWLGLMEGLSSEINDVRDHMSFADARDNFMKASRNGIDSNFTWFNDTKISATELIKNQLLPLARKGLIARDINSDDIDRYLGVIEGRCKNHMTGSRWLLRAFTKLEEETSADEAVTAITASILENQRQQIPVHEWKMPELKDLSNYSPGNIHVEEFMGTDLFTVRSEDIIELVADLMDWRKIRYAPVEDEDGKLVGLVTSRLVMRGYKKLASGETDALTVEEIMIKNPVTISPRATIKKAISVLTEQKIGCLPVVEDGALVGIVTETDFMKISSRLLNRLSQKDENG